MTHDIDSDGLCNYRCMGCGWRYAHIGWGDPDTVAMNWFEDFHNIEGDLLWQAVMLDTPTSR